MEIESLRKYRGRPTIYELPGPLRFKAQQWLSRLIGQAKSRGRPLSYKSVRNVPTSYARLRRHREMKTTRETIAEFLGDDALQSAGYGLYGMFGKPAAVPAEEKVARGIQEQIAAGELTDPTSIMIRRRQLEAKERRKMQPVHFGRRPRQRNGQNASW